MTTNAITSDSSAWAASGDSPMLSRVADALYWLARYTERAEHVARVILESSHVLTDVGDLDPKLKLDLWRGNLGVFNLDSNPKAASLLESPVETMGQIVSKFMAFDADNPSSMFSCIVGARDNARSVREHISSAMWENLNTLYWSLSGDETRAKFDESPQEVCLQVIVGSMLFQGLTDQTLSHGQGWLFMQLGRNLERIDLTCRILEAKFNVLDQADSMETPLRNIHWMSLLRSCGALEGYRRVNTGELDPMHVVGFLLLQPGFPRSVRHCVGQAHEAIARIRGSIDPHRTDPAERFLGRLNTQLEYAEVADVTNVGLAAYLRKIQGEIALAAEAVRKAYFLH